jgi:hypothetical protein
VNISEPLQPAAAVTSMGSPFTVSGPPAQLVQLSMASKESREMATITGTMRRRTPSSSASKANTRNTRPACGVIREPPA